MAETQATTPWSLGTIKAYLVLSDGSQDALLVQIGDRVAQQFERRTGRLFVKRTGLSETWSGDGRRSKFLKYAPLVTLDSLSVDGTAAVPANYAVDLERGLVGFTDGTVFTEGFLNCVAGYGAGYGVRDDPTTLPADLFEAGLEQVKVIYDEKKSGAVSAQSVNVGPVSLVVTPKMNFNIADILDALRDMRA